MCQVNLDDHNLFSAVSYIQLLLCMSRKENPQKLTQLSSRSHPRHLVGKRTAHVIYIYLLSDTPFQMKKSFVKATKGTFLYSWAEFAMGRVCNGPSLLWAEFVMGRDVPEPLGICVWITVCHTCPARHVYINALGIILLFGPRTRCFC